MTFNPFSSKLIMVICLIVFQASCDYNSRNRLSDKTDVPDDISELGNLTILPAGAQLLDTVLLTVETVFESNENVFIDGYIDDLAIDYSGRVFISATRPGVVGIYVFEPDGKYLETLSRYGRGPGEFESISSIEIFQDRLFVYDSRLQKYAVISTNDFTLMHDESIKKSQVQNDAFYRLMRGSHLYALADSNLLIQFQVNNLYNINSYPHIRFYKIDENGDIESEAMVELNKYQYYMNAPKAGNDGMRFPFTAPFSRTSLFTYNDRFMYSAWTEDFVIKKYDYKGTLLDSLEIPFKKALLELNNMRISDWKKREVKKEGIPKTWPALFALEADDEDRIWVSVITESDSTFGWYVINDKKEIIAQFEYPGSKANIFARSEPVIIIKNGYFYAHHFDFEKNIDRIVKYKVKFKPR